MTWLEQKEVINWKFITIEKKYVYPIQIKSCSRVGVFRCFILDLFKTHKSSKPSEDQFVSKENGYIFKCEFEEIWPKTTNHICEPFALRFRRSQSAHRSELPTKTKLEDIENGFLGKA